MCGRYVTRTEAAMEHFWELRRPPPLFDSFNVAPTQQIPIIRELKDEGREALLMRWGLIPTWAKGLPQKYSTINATVERMQTAPAYRNAWRRSQRCLIPANAFYEWQTIPDQKQKQPYYYDNLTTVVDAVFIGKERKFNRRFMALANLDVVKVFDTPQLSNLLHFQ